MSRDGRFDVFLSYARSDGVAAAELNSWLRAHGFRTFFDRSDLRPGFPWIRALEDAIRRSNAVAILIGRHGMGNTQQYERELALVRQTRDKRFPVIPVLLPGCENPPTGFLQLLTWIDLSRDGSALAQTDSLEALCRAVRRQPVPPSAVRAQFCPYRGLEPFREEDHALYCGRDDVIRDLVSKVQTHSFVAVVGSSGSGKSSLVFAGLLPALRQQRQTKVWDVVSFRPGASPLRALADAFGTAPQDVGPASKDTYLENEAAAYRGGDLGKLRRVINDRLDAAPEKPDRVLIYVDQWEELYAMAPTIDDAKQRRQHFSDVEKMIALLVAASSGEKSRASVVLTVRADFYNFLIRNTLVSGILPRQQVNIPPMGRNDLRSAIETPAQKTGLSFVPPALVDQILDDVGTEDGRLPLLQFALKETWERRDGDRLSAAAYTEVGGVTGAIQKTAEGAYAALTPAQQSAARRLFLRLVTPGEGREDVRARSTIPEDPQQRDIVDLFSHPRTRLLVTGYDTPQGPAPQEGRDPRATVEVAHEALIRRWPTLRAWVDESRQKLRARAAILRAKAEWEEKGSIDKFLLDPGIQLERGRSLLDSPGDVPVDDIRKFVDLSIQKEKRRLDAERESALAAQKRITAAERQAKEAAEDAARQSEAARAAERQAKEAAEDAARLSEAARVAADVARRKLRNRWRLAVSATVIALVAFGGSLYQWRMAQHQLDRANQALATGILADLDLRSDSLTARHRNALWKLARADEAVRADFISALTASPEYMARSAAGFREICRSLGLQWPSPAEAEKLLTTATAAIAVNSSAGQPLQALPAKLTEAQAQQALDPLLKRIGETTHPLALLALVKALQALPVKLTDAQAQQALDPPLKQIGKTTDPRALQAPVGALRALPAKLIDAQALDSLLRQIGKTTDHRALQALAGALPAKLTEAQAQQALDPLLKQIGETTDRDGLQALAGALQALAAKLTEAQEQQALDLLLKQIGKTTDPDGLQALAKALAAKLTEAQAQQALDPLLKQIGRATDRRTVEALAGALQALPAKLTEAQAQQALDPLLKQIGETTDPDELQALAGALQALPAKLTEAQAQQALGPLLKQIGETTDPDELPALAGALQALAAKLTDTQAQHALDPLLKQIGETTDDSALQALAGALQALAAKLTDAQAQQALDPLLKQIGKTTDPSALQALAGAFQALVAKLTDAQAQQVLDPLLKRIGETTDPDGLQALAGALQVLVTKLTDAQAQQALAVAISSLGWAGQESEAVEWARVLVALLPRATDQERTRILVEAILYPFAAGPATEVLLDALRARTDAPAKEVGMSASLAWIAAKYHQAYRPACPTPPQPTSPSGLKCPVE